MDDKRQRVERAFDLLASGLRPFVESRLGPTGVVNPEDPGALCAQMLSRWNDAFADLGDPTRTLVVELETARNRAPHSSSLSTGDLLRLVDSATRLLEAIGAPEGIELAIMHNELQRPAPPARALWRWSGVAAAVVFFLGGFLLLQWNCAGKAARQSPVAKPAQQMTICGAVTRTQHGSPTLIVVQDARSRTSFTIVIRDAARPAFVAALGKDPETAYAGQSLCVTGAFGSYEGAEAIEVYSPEAIRLN
jgi:hypothetical protein